MRHSLTLLRSLTACALIAFLAFSPARLQAELERNPYREFLGGGNDESWSGIITVWHVVEFKTYQGSVTAFLESSAAMYEKANPGVYIEVVGLTEETARERISRGEKPDVWSLPVGILNMADFLTLPEEDAEFAGSLEPYRREGHVKAYPYLFSGYYLIGNTALTQSLGFTFPTMEQNNNGEMKEMLQSAVSSNSTTRYGALCAPYILAARLNITGKLASDGDFKAGQVPFMIGDARALGDIQRRKEGFTVDILALGGYTEQVQYIGIDMGAEAEKKPHCEGLIKLLLGEERQLKLTALGAIPAVKSHEMPSYTDSILTALYEAYKEPQTPDPARYSIERDSLEDEARGALSGESSAKQMFEKRMNELTRMPGIVD